MKTVLAVTLLLLVSTAANAEYRKIDMTVFGMDCAPCAHAIHVSMKGIQGVDTVDVDLNSGHVAITLKPDNGAGIGQIQDAIRKNGFTYKGASVFVRGTLTGSSSTPVLQVTGTKDHYELTPQAQPANVVGLIGKTVDVEGSLSNPKKNKVPETLQYQTITEAK